jgi:hypothetical protein
MYLTLQRTTGLWFCQKKRIVGVENVVEEEGYNQFDEIPSFHTSYKPRLLGTNKTLYLRSDHSEKIHIQKSKKKRHARFLLNPFCNEDVSISGNGFHFVI